MRRLKCSVAITQQYAYDPIASIFAVIALAEIRHYQVQIPVVVQIACSHRIGIVASRGIVGPGLKRSVAVPQQYSQSTAAITVGLALIDHDQIKFPISIPVTNPYGGGKDPLGDEIVGCLKRSIPIPEKHTYIAHTAIVLSLALICQHQVCSSVRVKIAGSNRSRIGSAGREVLRGRKSSVAYSQQHANVAITAVSTALTLIGHHQIGLVISIEIADCHGNGGIASRRVALRGLKRPIPVS
jgi:hypothetical protein